MVITIRQLHSTKPVFRFCVSSNPVRGVLEVDFDENIWQWSRLEVRLNPLRGNPSKCSKTVKQFACFCQQIVLSVFNHFVGLALKGLTSFIRQPFCKKQLTVISIITSTIYTGITLAKIFKVNFEDGITGGMKQFECPSKVCHKINKIRKRKIFNMRFCIFQVEYFKGLVGYITSCKSNSSNNNSSTIR